MEDKTPEQITPSQALGGLVQEAAYKSQSFRKALKLKVRTHNKTPPLGWYIAQLEQVYGTKYVKEFCAKWGIRKDREESPQ